MKHGVALTLRLNSELYEKAKKIAKDERESFTRFVQTALEERLKREERKRLFNAFTQAAEDKKESDMDFAFASQQELALKNE